MVQAGAVLVNGPGHATIVGVPMEVRDGVLVEQGVPDASVVPDETVVATSQTPLFVEHRISDADTLPLLALKYNVAEISILRANMLLSSDSFEFLGTGTIIKVPADRDHPVIPATLDDKTEAVIAMCARYQRRTGETLSRDAARRYLEDHQWDAEEAYKERLSKQEAIIRMTHLYEHKTGERINRQEAEFYLMDHDWDMDEACKARVADMEWEKKHPFRPTNEAVVSRPCSGKKMRTSAGCFSFLRRQ
eukprot:TRINITY_DN29334_c0_g1_i1.p1 TRINITY_DN29334_c0_g1~~TRINITY_DN29334_c0_g1_i1.p1  ORF type:complete len:266 (+),score=91.13 TRINITY_DN29334_c0_g1_i1:56-799(+)